MKTNAQVAAAFIAGESAHSANMHSTGTILYSYATPIAYRESPDRIRVSTQHHSPTTTSHHSHLWTAAHEAGYRGPAWWEGSPDRKRRGGRTQADTVPFHDGDFPATRYGRAKTGSYHYGEPRNQSDHDARAVIWQRLTPEELRQERERNRRELDALLANPEAFYAAVATGKS